MAKEKLNDYNRVFGTMIVFNDGTTYTDNFDSVELGNILATWRGSITTFTSYLRNVYEHDNSTHFHDTRNNEGEKVVIPIKRISYIKYVQNTGMMGSKKDPRVYDWDKDFD